MNTKSVSTKGIVIICVATAVLIALFSVFYTQFVQKPTEGEKDITVTVVFADESTKAVEINTDAEYLRGALDEKDLISGAESDYGFYIITVDGVTADGNKNEWWCITKGGEMVTTGVDTTPIEDGDKFELTLSTY